jgi:hypothetical protein
MQIAVQKPNEVLPNCIRIRRSVIVPAFILTFSRKCQSIIAILLYIIRMFLTFSQDCSKILMQLKHFTSSYMCHERILCVCVCVGGGGGGGGGRGGAAPPILAITPPQTKCPPLQKNFQPPPNIRHYKK